MDMETEPRRSSRSTKGQHSQKQDIEVEVQVAVRARTTSKARSKPRSQKSKQSKTTKKNGKPSNASSESEKVVDEEADEEEDEDGVVRCVCGIEDDETKPLMAQCEKCLVWQHTECTMGVTDEKDVPEKYFCEQCRPDLYKNYLNTLNPDEQSKPETNEHAELEKKDQAEVEKIDEPSETDKQKQIESADDDDGDEFQPEDTKKRKALTSEREELPKQIRTDRKSLAQTSRKVSTSAPGRAKSSTKAPVFKVEHIEGLQDKVRQSVANALLGILEKCATAAVAAGSLTLAEDETPHDHAEKIAIDIEHGIFEQLATKTEKDVGAKYRDKFRTISFNLKDAKNATFRERVVLGQIDAQSIVNLTSEEMMNPELQKLAETVRAESISQSILKKTEAPRIRRTHKGEEFVGDDDSFITQPEPESVTISKDGEQNDQKQDETVTNENIENVIKEPPNNSRSRSNSPPPPNFNDSAGFGPATDDFEREYSPDMYDPASLSPPPTGLSPRQQLHEYDDDDEIDRLIRDEPVTDQDNDADNSYSPQLQSFDHTIWEGTISMSTVAQLNATAVQVGGPLFDEEIRKWRNVVPPSIDVDGRIPSDRASSYLYDVASTKDIVAIEFKISDASSKQQQAEFTKLFDYFRSRDRYGVLRNKNIHHVKDAYLVPLLPADSRPPFVSMISSFSIPKSINRPMLLGIYVVNKVYSRRSVSADHDPLVPASLDRGPVQPGSPPPLSSLQPSQSQAVPSSTNDSVIATALAGLGLSQHDANLLHQIVSNSPEIIANPSLIGDSLFLIGLVSKYSNNH
ncbi:transcription factor S-II, central domain-containing protein [Lipomyces japonicus]|uniref:transcription factor S-II, central domain-containing protein n=1 Tax=Lipomyces japonicus TaxID=56871 RepID=UPI0034CD85EA